MSWYLFILSVILFFGAFSAVTKHMGRNIDKIVFLLCVLLLWFFAAMRMPGVGADSAIGGYANAVFRWIIDVPWSQVPFVSADWHRHLQNPEPLFKVFSKIVSGFSHDDQAIIIASSTLLMTFVSLLILHHSPNYWMSIFLFFTIAFYQTALNITPSSIASYFCLYASLFAVKKKPISYFVLVGIASLFHTACIAFIPVYFLLNIRLTTGRIRFIIALSVILPLSYFDWFRDIFYYITPIDFHHYLDRGTNERYEQLLVWAVHILLFVFCWFIAGHKNKGFVERHRTAFVFIVLETFFYLLSTNLAIFARVSILFAPYLIVAIPQMLYDEDSPLNLNKNENPVLSLRRERIISLTPPMIIIMSVLIYLVRSSVNNIGMTIPYFFFWQ